MRTGPENAKASGVLDYARPRGGTGRRRGDWLLAMGCCAYLTINLAVAMGSPPLLFFRVMPGFVVVLPPVLLALAILPQLFMTPKPFHWLTVIGFVAAVLSAATITAFYVAAVGSSI